MNKQWIWGLGIATLLLAVVFAVPRFSQNNQRLNQGTLPGTPVRSDLDMNRSNMPNADAPSMELSTRVEKRVVDAARSVEGVDQAWAAVKDTTAVVGLELDPSIKSDLADDIEKEVVEQVKELPEITNAGATTNPNIVRQIQEINRADMGNRPAAQMDDELNKLISQVISSTR